jgi:hypothetical protein
MWRSLLHYSSTNVNDSAPVEVKPKNKDNRPLARIPKSPLNPPILGDFESISQSCSPQNWGARGARDDSRKRSNIPQLPLSVILISGKRAAGSTRKGLSRCGCITDFFATSRVSVAPIITLAIEISNHKFLII